MRRLVIHRRYLDTYSSAVRDTAAFRTGGQQWPRKVVFPPWRLFKRVKSISGRGRHTAILINFSRPTPGGFSRVRAFPCEKQRRRSDLLSAGTGRQGNPRARAETQIYNAKPSVLRVTQASLAGESRHKKINAATCCWRTRAKQRATGTQDGGEKPLDKREIPPTPLIFPPFPIIPSLNRREWNMKAHARPQSRAQPSV